MPVSFPRLIHCFILPLPSASYELNRPCSPWVGEVMIKVSRFSAGISKGQFCVHLCADALWPTGYGCYSKSTGSTHREFPYLAFGVRHTPPRHHSPFTASRNSLASGSSFCDCINSRSHDMYLLSLSRTASFSLYFSGMRFLFGDPVHFFVRIWNSTLSPLAR